MRLKNSIDRNVLRFMDDIRFNEVCNASYSYQERVRNRQNVIITVDEDFHMANRASASLVEYSDEDGRVIVRQRMRLLDEDARSEVDGELRR